MFINFSNHPSQKWDEEQRMEAQKYGQIVDVSFPMVEPSGDEAYIANLADISIDRILSVSDQVDAVMVQGEYTLTYEVVKRLLKRGIRVVSACTERKVNEVIDDHGNMIRQSTFRFVRFREYCINDH